MATPNNTLINVATYNDAFLAGLQNQNCFVGTSNTRFNNFQNISGQLGQTVTYDRNPRVTVTKSLVAQWQPADQRILSLTVDKPYLVGLQFTDEQVIFNDVRSYMDKWGKSSLMNIGGQVEADIAQVCETTPYRFYGDGKTAINSYNQLASVVTQQKNFGSAGDFKGYIPLSVQTAVVSSGLNQFVMDRNERIANSWEVGAFSGCEWYTSNLLPVHYSGTAGETGNVLTVVSTTTDATGGVIAITFQATGNVPNDLNFVKKYDRFQFQDGIPNLPNMRFLTFTSYKPTECPLQFLATADAATDGASRVTVNITPPLRVLVGNEQNITSPIVADLQVKAMPSHRVGMVTTGNPLFVAMPALPETSPFTSSRASDKESGVGMRTYHGYMFGMGASGIVHDCIMGYSLDADYSIAILFPL